MFNKINKSQFISACLLVPALLGLSTAKAENEFRIISGTFFMGTVTDSIIFLSPGNNPGVLIEDTYQGVSLSDTNQVLFAPFTFFGQPVGTYTAATGVDAVTHAAPTVNLATGQADLGAFYAYWNGTEFNQGNLQTTVIDNFDGTYFFFWSSLIAGGPFDGKTGDWTMLAECTTCPPSAAGITLGLTTTQAGQVTNTVTQDLGDFVVSIDLEDTAGYTFNWSPTDDTLLDPDRVETDPTLTIDPSTVPVGTYQVKVNVSNGNTDPAEKSSSTFLLHIVETGDLAEIGDADNDGIQNSADTIDNLITPTLLQAQAGNNDTYIIEAGQGRITLGDTAICIAATSTAVTSNDIKNNGGDACAAVSNATDTLGAVETGVGGYNTIAVRDLNKGGTVRIAIPLSEPLKKNAGYRWYSQINAWKPFATGIVNKVFSAKGEPGVCPDVQDGGLWTEGLAQGDNCIRLTITDGGVNDTDGKANGIVTTTGTTIGYAGIDSNLLSEGCSISGNPKGLHEHIEWILLTGFLAWLGYRRRSHVKLD